MPLLLFSNILSCYFNFFDNYSACQINKNCLTLEVIIKAVINSTICIVIIFLITIIISVIVVTVSFVLIVVLVLCIIVIIKPKLMIQSYNELLQLLSHLPVSSVQCL